MKKLLILVLALCAQLTMAQDIQKMNIVNAVDAQTVQTPQSWTSQGGGAAGGTLKIGYLEYSNVQFDVQHQLYVRAYFFTIYKPTITADWLSFSDLILTVDGVSSHWRPFTCPTAVDGSACGGLFVISSPTAGAADGTCSKGCTAVTMQLVSPSGGLWMIPLASGEMYPVWGINTTTIVPLQGQRFLKDHQRVTLELHLDAGHK